MIGNHPGLNQRQLVPCLIYVKSGILIPVTSDIRRHQSYVTPDTDVSEMRMD